MQTFQFKIQIKHLQNPAVWRRVLVPSDITFDDLHEIIQIIFGWENSHLYQFSEKGYSSQTVYKVPDEYDGDTVEDSEETIISEVFTKPKQTFTYIYDFGDDWTHHIVLEKITDTESTIPVCLAGEGACPPEDCGGIYGYNNLIEILSDPKNPEYKEMKSWLGLGKNEQWDVSAFDIEVVNEEIKGSFN
ncbi:plasmid pRiA4b ORF-3 family protein [Mucilaginibacter sp.]|uniref:plasmid pRiA4b ORF-3 family protein n=1 Tax=Mucilaginibacter sp. TaxID=1882438 RepID=UPI002ED1714B